MNEFCCKSCGWRYLNAIPLMSRSKEEGYTLTFFCGGCGEKAYEEKLGQVTEEAADERIGNLVIAFNEKKLFTAEDSIIFEDGESCCDEDDEMFENDL